MTNQLLPSGHLLDATEFTTHRVELPHGVELAYIREGIGGTPLVLLHGWPETKRIWWRNIRPLADAGFEVIAPDLRGFGESGAAPDGFYDVATMSRDIAALLAELGHPAAVFAGGDYGGMIVQDIAQRFPGLLNRQVLFNVLTPILPELYEEHGVGGDALAEVNAVSDHVVVHAQHADELAARLSRREQRLSYIAEFYTDRGWAAAGSFDRDSAGFMSDPFGDSAVFRDSLRLYSAFFEPSQVSEPALLDRPHDNRTLILYGREDGVVGPLFTRRMELACSDAVGPFIIEGAGHFLQYERAEVFNESIRTFCLDLLTGQPVGAGAEGRP